MHLPWRGGWDLSLLKFAVFISGRQHDKQLAASPTGSSCRCKPLIAQLVILCHTITSPRVTPSCRTLQACAARFTQQRCLLRSHKLDSWYHSVPLPEAVPMQPQLAF